MGALWQVIRKAFQTVRCPGCQPVAPHGVNRERFNRHEVR